MIDNGDPRANDPGYWEVAPARGGGWVVFHVLTDEVLLRAATEREAIAWVDEAHRRRRLTP